MVEIHLSADQVNNYLDNPNTSQDSEFIHQHIQNCEVCKKSFSELKEIHEELKKIPLLELKTDINMRIMKKVMVNLKRNRQHNGFLITIMTILISPIISLLYYVLSGSGNSTGSETAINRINDYSSTIYIFLTEIFKSGYNQSITMTILLLSILSFYFFFDKFPRKNL
jgi:hypothetical protein